MNYKVLMAAFLVATVARADGLDPIPSGWVASGMPAPSRAGGRCEMGVDAALAGAGQPNLSIKCESGNFEGLPENPLVLRTVLAPSGLLRQTFEAVGYYGKRVRFSGWLKSDGIADLDGMGGGGLFITVPSDSGSVTDRMEDRKLSGWTDWEYRDFVVDVPDQGGWIVIGFWMRGEGQIWMKDLEFEVVPDSVPVNLFPQSSGPLNQTIPQFD